jgi:hypothetical protein
VRAEEPREVDAGEEDRLGEPPDVDPVCCWRDHPQPGAPALEEESADSGRADFDAAVQRQEDLHTGLDDPESCIFGSVIF